MMVIVRLLCLPLKCCRSTGWNRLFIKKTGLDRAHLYRVLSSKGNPRFLTLGNILKALGFKLSVNAI
ncbi:DNA-binding protein [Fastidiosibacter lacustris]|uniref:helix-turn-helix domain-containing transcriptional regulator n=1 Tax=Fastidiosibacter lacustris TaxID=2056695 RepID=UPI003B839B9B